MAFVPIKIEQVAALGPTQVGDALLRLAQAKNKVYSASALGHWSSHWRRWLKSCADHRFAVFPMTDDSLRAFLFDCAARDAELKTVANYRRTLALVHQLADVPFAWKASEEADLWQQALSAVSQARERGALPVSDMDDGKPAASKRSARTDDAGQVDCIDRAVSSEPTPSGGELLWHIERILEIAASSITALLSAGARRPASEVTALAQMEMHVTHAKQVLLRVQHVERVETISFRGAAEMGADHQVTSEVPELTRRLRLACALIDELLSRGLVRLPADVRALDACQSSVGFALWKIQATTPDHGEAASVTPTPATFHAEEIEPGSTAFEALTHRVESLEQRWAQVGAVLIGGK